MTRRSFWISALIGLAVFLTFFNFSYLKLNTADSSIYLSTAENIAGHKGFVVSYNLCQSFNTLYHAVLPYYQPLYSFFCSLFIHHGGIVRIIQINILIFALNAALIFYIIQSLMPTRFNILFTLFLAFSFNFFISAVYPWTEQFHFFFFIITFIFFLKYKGSPRHLFWLGVLNGVCMLIRVAHMYNFLAFLPVLFIGKDTLRQKFERAFYFAGGFVLMYGLYQLFCLIVYHALYPQYAKPGMSYGLARLTDGIIYTSDKVGIQVLSPSFFSVKNFWCVAGHLRDFYRLMPFFLWPACFYYFLPVEKRRDGGLVALCFSQSIFTVLGYSCTFYWLPVYFESVRYSMIPYALMSLAGWYCLYQGVSFSESAGRKFIGILVLVVLLYPQVHKFMVFKMDLFKHPMWSSPYCKDLMEGYDWIDQNLPKDILVASDEVQEGYFMHRPFISTPPGRSYNCTNLALYDHIYAPDYYLLSGEVTDECFTAIAHTTVFSNKTFRLLKIIK